MKVLRENLFLGLHTTNHKTVVIHFADVVATIGLDESGLLQCLINHRASPLGKNTDKHTSTEHLCTPSLPLAE